MENARFCVGAAVGDDGAFVADGEKVGLVGLWVGRGVGVGDGMKEGDVVGISVGRVVGVGNGMKEGTGVGG